MIIFAAAATGNKTTRPMEDRPGGNGLAAATDNAAAQDKRPTDDGTDYATVVKDTYKRADQQIAATNTAMGTTSKDMSSAALPETANRQQTAEHVKNYPPFKVPMWHLADPICTDLVLNTDNKTE